jgi:ankyrin repeat protein
LIGFLNFHRDEYEDEEFAILMQVRILASLEANLETTGERGLTLIHSAATLGHTETLRFLMDAGVNIDVQDDYGWTPLQCAVTDQHIGVVRALLEKNANPLLSTTEKHTRRYGRMLYAATPIHETAHQGWPYRVSLLIKCTKVLLPLLLFTIKSALIR